MREAPFRKILIQILQIVATIDRPIVPDTDHLTTPGAVADVRGQEAAAPRVALQGFVERRGVEDGNAAHPHDAPVGDGAVAGDHVERRAAQHPPRVGDCAVGNQAVVKDILIFLSFCPLTLKIERVTCSQDTRPGVDLRRRRAAHFIELARLLFDVVLHAIGIQLLAGGELLEANMPSSDGLGGIPIIVDLVRLK